MIKNKTILFLLLISILMLVACNTKKEEENVLDEFVSTIVFEESLTGDLNLQTEYNYKNNKILVNWESSNPNVLSNEGKYYYTLSDEMVTLSAVFTFGDESVNKYYDFISYANEDKAFEEAFSFLHLPDQTDVSLKFYDSIKYGKTTYRVSYVSSNPDIIENIVEIVTNALEKKLSEKVTFADIKNEIRRSVANYVYFKSERKPLVIPVVMDMK